VSAMVEEREAVSVTIVRPEGRVVTLERLPFLGAGEVAGTLKLIFMCKER
jgi:hypothetical protein